MNNVIHHIHDDYLNKHEENLSAHKDDHCHYDDPLNKYDVMPSYIKMYHSIYDAILY